ncbi:uncharacterized protein LOC101863937 [Aplysia californica]|uniref:Uncharacterized protein LOC101863937 n=1 Tax=Aplysia californica TaxID=6500 RepID=A0ABM0K7K2_APLCA|nr:uncharacterized protein LOC101863937 [Aplysia californica]
MPALYNKSQDNIYVRRLYRCECLHCTTSQDNIYVRRPYRCECLHCTTSQDNIYVRRPYRCECLHCTSLRTISTCGVRSTRRFLSGKTCHHESSKEEEGALSEMTDGGQDDGQRHHSHDG